MIPLMFILGQPDNNTVIPPFQNSNAYTNPCVYFNQTSSNTCNNTFILYKDGGVISEYGTTILNYGDSIEGGYYGGVINNNNKLYALIISSKTKQILGKKIKAMPSVKLTDLNNTSIYDGYHNTQYMLTKSASDFEAAHYIKTNLNDNNYNGYNDWYIPAYAELEIIYRHLTPTTNTPTFQVNCNDYLLRNIAGYNEYSYPCVNYKYTTLNESNNNLFKSGGNESLTGTNYNLLNTSSLWWTGSRYSVWILDNNTSLLMSYDAHSLITSTRPIRKVFIKNL